MDYKSFKMENLREILKSRGLKGWSKLKKSDLISLIEENDRAQRGVKKENPFGRILLKLEIHACSNPSLLFPIIVST